MQMPARQYYTAEMVRNMPDDGNRYETVYGELLVSPSPRPRHQIVGARILARLFRYLEENPGPMVLYSPADLSFGRDDVLVQPDIFVLRPEDATLTTWETVNRLLLAIEILSPSTQRHDRFTKRRLYQELGADEYWVVDPDGGSVEVWSPEAHFPRVETHSVSWTVPGAAAPLVLALHSILRA
jgi:Uma2 family endonuclease